MDTYNMEIDSIMESFKMDMIIIEHENFMNIMNKKQDGILNESVILEAENIFSNIIKKIKEFFKNIIDWIKTVFSDLKNKFKEFINKQKKIDINNMKVKSGEKIATDGLELYNSNQLYNRIELVCKNINIIANDAYKRYGRLYDDLVKDYNKNIDNTDSEFKQCAEKFKDDLKFVRNKIDESRSNRPVSFLNYDQFKIKKDYITGKELADIYNKNNEIIKIINNCYQEVFNNTLKYIKSLESNATDLSNNLKKTTNYWSNEEIMSKQENPHRSYMESMVSCLSMFINHISYIVKIISTDCSKLVNHDVSKLIKINTDIYTKLEKIYNY